MPAATVDIVIREQGAAAVKAKVSGIGNSLKAIGGIAKGLVAPMAGIFTVGALVSAGKKIMEFERALTVTAIQGRATAAQQEVLRQSITKTAMATGIGKDALLSFISSVTDATGNLQFAADTLDLVSKASVATGANLDGLGQMTSDMAMKFGLSGAEIADSLGVMIEQGDRGRMTLAEMARVAPEAMSVAGLAGMKGAAGVREMGAMLQIVRQGYGSAEEAATGFKTMVAQVYSAQNAKTLKKLGIQIEDPKTGKLRTFTDIFLDVIEKTKGATPMLMEIFGTRGILGAAPFAQLYKDAGGSIEAVRKELDKFEGVTADATTIGRKYARMEDTAAVKVGKVKEQFASLLEDTVLTPEVLDNVAAALDDLAISASAVAGLLGDTYEFWSKLAEKMGFSPAGALTTAGGTAAGAAGMTAAQQAARQGALEYAMTGKAGVMGAAGQEFEAWLAQSRYAGAAGGIKGSMAGTDILGMTDPLAKYGAESGMVNMLAAEYAKYVERKGGTKGTFAQVLAGAPGAAGQQSMAPAVSGSAGDPYAQSAWDFKITVLNADGATVEVKDPSGKLKPGKGASAQ